MTGRCEGLSLWPEEFLAKYFLVGGGEWVLALERGLHDDSNNGSKLTIPSIILRSKTLQWLFVKINTFLIFIYTGNYQLYPSRYQQQHWSMPSFILSFGNFCLLYLATLHFTGCWFWHHTLPGIALNLAWLKMNATVLQQETSFCGFGDRSGWSFNCAHRDNFNLHSYLTINFF